MKYKLFLHPVRPKIQRNRIQKLLKDLGVPRSSNKPDIAIIVGGDGTFGYYARRLMIPMLFVGVSDVHLLGSKARLAEIFLETLPESITKLQKGQYYLENRRLLCVTIRKICRMVFTDVYLERGDFGGCLRYSLTVKTEGKNGQTFTDYCIGNGVIISTSIGASGYFSYPQRLISEKVSNNFKFDASKIGICHINPYFIDRKLRRSNSKSNRPFGMQFTVPIESAIRIKLVRPSKAFLYGISRGSNGVEIGKETIVNVRASERSVNIIRLK